AAFSISRRARTPGTKSRNCSPTRGPVATWVPTLISSPSKSQSTAAAVVVVSPPAVVVVPSPAVVVVSAAEVVAALPPSSSSPQAPTSIASAAVIASVRRPLARLIALPPASSLPPATGLTVGDRSGQEDTLSSRRAYDRLWQRGYSSRMLRGDVQLI